MPFPLAPSRLARFYRYLGKAGIYTRKRGLDRGTNKALLLKHIEDNRAVGAKMEELRQVLPLLSRSQIQVLLREMKKQGLVHIVHSDLPGGIGSLSIGILPRFAGWKRDG